MTHVLSFRQGLHGSLLDKSDRELREDLLQKLVDQRLMGATAQLHMNMDPTKLPIRELPHGSYQSLYVMYVAFCKMSNQEHASRSTRLLWNGRCASSSTKRLFIRFVGDVPSCVQRFQGPPHLV